MARLSMGVSDMKKFLMNIAIFITIVAAVDYTLGEVFLYLQAKAGGRTGAEYYICEQAKEDVIVMGSSRATYHYVSNIISEKLGMTCFNAGKDGNGIIMQYGRWKLISRRYTPRILIYDITPEFDIEMNDNQRYIERLKPFCNNKSVRQYVSTLFPLERIKLLSRMYRYDSKIFEIISDFKRKEDFGKASGYIPLDGYIRQEVVEDVESARKSAIDSDPVKMYYLEQLIKETREKGITVYLVVSPCWKGGKYTEDAYSQIKKLADKYNVSFMNYIESSYCVKSGYFKDSFHLNDKGARVFTEDLVSKITI